MIEQAVEAAVDGQVAIAKFRFRMFCAVLILVFFSGMAYFVWHHGYDFADAKWVTAHNRKVKELNDKIERLENLSEKEASTLRTKIVELEKKLSKTVDNAPLIMAHDQHGDKLKCDGKEVIPYLGPDFGKVWNRLNEEGAMK